jgi:hypothetical protein
MTGQPVSIKDTLGEQAAAVPLAKQSAADRAKAVETSQQRAYVDNVTGEVYEDSSRCANGCTVFIGEDAVKIRAAKKVQPPQPIGAPPTAEAQTRAELRRLAAADADRAKAEADAAAAAAAENSEQAKDDERAGAEPAGAKAATPAEDKSRKQRPKTKKKR